MSERAPLIELLYKLRQHMMDHLDPNDEPIIQEIEAQLDWLHELDRKQEQFFNTLMSKMPHG